MRHLAVALSVFCPLVAASATSIAEAQTQPPRPAWVAKSDAHARVLLDVMGRLSPEAAGFFGVEGVDDRVLDLSAGYQQRARKAVSEAEATLQERLSTETDAAVRQDLQILLQAAKDFLEGSELNERHLIPYQEVPQLVFQGIRALLDDQVPPQRRANAVVRLRKYAGVEPGSVPVLELARERIREGLARPGLAGPYEGELERHLANSGRYANGIAQLFAKYELEGWQEAHERFQQQLAEYEAFLRAELLPRARTDYRLPPDLYAFSLRQFGVDIPPAELAARARVAFMEIRNEMNALAPLVARDKGLALTDYRDVLRELRKEQIVSEAILPHYRKRLEQIEAIIADQEIVTLPTRAARIRLASEAESAAIPAPNMRPPRLVGNTGEMGEFVLPLRVPTGDAGGEQSVDDFTHAAASWTLTVHEARPGHELQFASVVEKGVSLARGLFAVNSVNVEGWALYAEAEMKPYLPLDGQLVSLQHRLMRAARAFLDPELQAGQVTPEQALRFLREHVVLSEAMARQEVDRYTFMAPGQATSYFYGYTRWMQLKSQAEFALGDAFDRRSYHDFVLAQGFLPPDVLAEAVMQEFVPTAAARAASRPPVAGASRH